MSSLSASTALQLPVRLRGIQLGRPVDLLLDPDSWQALGFVVHCGDAAPRFLPFAASQPSSDEIAVGSALMLLEDAGFYEQRGASFRSLVGGQVEQAGRALGVLRDIVLGRGGAVRELEVDRDGAIVRVHAAGVRIASTRATAA